MTKHQKKQGVIAGFGRFVLCLLLISSFFASLSARNNCPDQGPRLSAEEYCRLYAAEAQRQMKLYGIPASITLAQGMFESGYGSSFIAVVGNNHFGIKAYRDWNGPTIQCDDDRKSEPFCKFSSVREGFEHHSKFLRNGKHYAPLFKLSSKDYKGWAKGLRECGYATDSKYPSRLIDLIERYGLDRYDRGDAVSSTTTATTTKPGTTSGSTSASSGQPHYQSTYSVSSTRHKLYSTSAKGGLKYVRAHSRDYLSVISREFRISERKLRRYNDMTKYYKLTEGEIIYLESKRSRADASHAIHVVKKGETLHGISQKYGVTVASIVKRNNLHSGAVQVGQTLRLR